jgi:prepilin-type N-terminal cleavage/methylation domain-containing protein
MTCYRLKNKQAGYTLLEILISITLLSLLLIVVFESLTVIRNTASKIETKKNIEKDIYMFFTHLSNLFKNLSSIKVFNNISKSYYFLGTEDEIIFISKDPIIFSYPVPHYIDIKFNGGQHQLGYREKIYLESGKYAVSFNFSNEPYDILLDNVENFKVSYLIWDNVFRKFAWQKYTDSFKKDIIPIKIKIDISRDKRDYQFIFKRLIDEEYDELPAILLK